MDGNKFIHGTLEATVFHATPFAPSLSFSCLSAGARAAYVTIKIGNHKMARTTHERNRVWNQTFQILCAHPIDSTITITMKTKCSILGKIQFQAHQLVNQASLINGFFPLLSEEGKTKPKLGLQFILWFKPADLEPTWEKLIAGDNFNGLRNATFPQRSNCSVTLYHDAHHTPSFQPPLSFHEPPGKLWEDVYRALEGAKHLIYIAGWSFNPKMVLVRDENTEIPRAIGVTLGELLKQKAEEGVAVRIMLWNDESSIPLIKNKGLMKTHDEDALAYFRNTKVICRLCPRLHSKFPTFFSHHQKTITADIRAEDAPNKREIMSFIGGVDLCDGRYDTEQHSLFKTLNTESHAHDYYQTSIAGACLHRGGPREPWHDAHACITGDAAWDMLTNFEQRWTKQCDPSLLVPVSAIGNINKQCLSSNSDRNWNVQVFRSIDHFSASPLSEKIKTEKSIHDAYVEAIRKADNFIYIENQYFIGGCGLWETDQSSGCRNLIPVEIALKVTNKIRARERFSIYVVIPMWPEGSPESETVQDILHWTRETMTMMYRLIGEAIKETGHQAHPTDYLNFFCLANREEKRPGEFIPPFSPHPSTLYWNAQANRRFMVYVHSKLMIVDDRYMLIGSANINQRSMDGARDTEIAIGCYQTEKHDENQQKNGGIYAYRMSLWYEHSGRAEKEFEEPHSLECVAKVRSIGEHMWKIYSEQEIVDMNDVHLVSYPVNVGEDGRLADLEGCSSFPDTQAPIKGKRSKFLPPIFTT
ncbi:hypothetical protein RND81_04G145300 [Saponaria officinalis]|uniref:Phospholipase D n=1 Tax=Saponaria officinalis TaxID=3572 RepID=A0AAW1LL74_SAPOF